MRGRCLAYGKELILGWDRARNDLFFQGRGMRRPADSAGNRVVDRVVVDVEGHAEDVHWQVDRHDEEDAHGLIIGDGEEVVFGVDLEPFRFEHEVEVRVGGVARSEHKAILETPVDAGHSLHHLGDETFVVEGRNHQSSRSRINNRVECLINLSVVVR